MDDPWNTVWWPYCTGAERELAEELFDMWTELRDKMAWQTEEFQRLRARVMMRRKRQLGSYLADPSDTR